MRLVITVVHFNVVSVDIHVCTYIYVTTSDFSLENFYLTLPDVCMYMLPEGDTNMSPSTFCAHIDIA